MPETESPAARIHGWWPSKDGRCGVLSDDHTHYCDQPKGHSGDHEGPELPTITLDERTTR